VGQRGRQNVWRMTCPRIPSGVIVACWYYIGRELLLIVCLYATYTIFWKMAKAVVRPCTATTYIYAWI